MTWFDEWNKAGRPRPDKLAMEAIRNLDRYDRQDEDAINKQIADYRIARRDLCEIAPTGDHLWSDGYHQFAKAAPELRDPADMRPSFTINRHVEAELLKLPEFERLRQWTTGDAVASAIALTTMGEDLQRLYDRMKQRQGQAEELERKLQEMLEAEQGKTDLDEMISRWAENPDIDPEMLKRMQDLADAAQKAIQEGWLLVGQESDDLEQAIGVAVASGVASMRGTLNDAANDAQALDQASQAWGMERGELRRMDATKRMELARRMDNEKFRRIAELWGPMQRIADTEQTRKIYHLPEEVVDIEISNDLAHILPAELLALEDPLLELDFFRRYVEGQLITYKLQGIEKVGKGAIIVCIDSSGSMGGEREIWSKAVALCSLHLAREQKRAYRGIIFGSAYETMEFDFSTPESITVERVLDYAEFAFMGGTDFMAPLNIGLKRLQEEFASTGKVDADLVFVTDGMCGVTPEWMANFKAEQERIHFKCHGVAIGCPATSEPLAQICDKDVVTIQDLISGEALRGMFRDL